MPADPKLHQKSPFTRRAFFWVTLILFVGSVAGQWTSGWAVFVNEQQEHGQQAEFSEFLPEVTRNTLENWQAEFMSILWQIGGLAVLFAVGSPQSREGDERQEKKIDLILKAVDPKNADKEIEKLDRDYARG
jgi:hypothetical protein